MSPRDQNRSKRSGTVFLLAIFVVVSLVFTTFWYREASTGPLHSARKVASIVTDPITEAGHWIFTPVRSVGAWSSGLFENHETQKELEAENKKLRSTVMALEESRLEAERLRKLLEIKSASELKSVGARIIGTTSDNWSDAIIIDKGTNDGVEAGMAVMGQNGLIGKIVESGPFSSTVQLVSDPTSGVAAMIQSSRAEGVAKGSSTGKLQLDFISKDTTVTPGDVVITSGMGGVFPKGIVLGEVTSATADTSSIYQLISVEPSVDAKALEEVLVITGEKTQQERDQ